MPPLNRRMTDVEKDGSVYTVDVTEQNAGPDGDTTHDEDMHHLASFEGAVRVAVNELDGQPKVGEAGTGMMFFYEPHDDGETYRQVVVRERRVFTLA